MIKKNYSASRKEFADRLVEAMKEAGHVARRGAKSGVDYYALAKMAGVTPEMARRYTLGTALPDPDRMLTIAKRLSVNLPWLRDGIGPKRGAIAFEASPREQEMIEKWRKMEPEDQRSVERHINLIDEQRVRPIDEKKTPGE